MISGEVVTSSITTTPTIGGGGDDAEPKRFEVMEPAPKTHLPAQPLAKGYTIPSNVSGQLITTYLRATTLSDELDDSKKSDLPKPGARALAEDERVKERRKARRPSVPIEVKTLENGQATLAKTVSDSDLYERRVLDTFGTDDINWVNEILASIGHATHKAVGVERGISAGLAFFNGVEPKNELEAALAAQMYATHVMTMRMAGRAELQEHFDAITTLYGQYNKLARTFTAQVEALAKLRGGGKQVVEVTHNHIDARNSQNVIAETVNTGGGGNLGNAGQPHAQSLEHQACASVVPLRGKDEIGESVPVASDQGEAALQDARRQGIGGTGGQA